MIDVLTVKNTAEAVKKMDLYCVLHIVLSSDPCVCSVTFKDKKSVCVFVFLPCPQAKMRDSWLYSLHVQHFNILGNTFVLKPLHTFLQQYDKNKYFSISTLSYVI